MKNSDALTVLEEVALALKDAALEIDGSSDFDRGRAVAYYEALSAILSHCAVAGIDVAEIGLGGFVAESVLRCVKEDS